MIVHTLYIKTVDSETRKAVLAQMRAGHNYRNELVAIERGRRWALRQAHETPEVAEAIALLKAATRSNRFERLKALTRARRQAEEAIEKPQVYLACEAARIALRDEAAGTPRKKAAQAVYDAAREALCQSDEFHYAVGERDNWIRKAAYNDAKCNWGIRAVVNQAFEALRKTGLYERDGVTAWEPRFRRWAPNRPTGTIGVQLQGGLDVKDALSGDDTQVKLLLNPPIYKGSRQQRVRQFGELWVRIGSDGRSPIWARFNVMAHRALPTDAKIKWVKVHLTRTGPFERWEAHLTLDASAPPRPITNDRAVAVELLWSPQDDGSITAAHWRDGDGAEGFFALPAIIPTSIRKPDGIQSVRELLLNKMRPDLVALIKHYGSDLPVWLKEATNTLHLWESPLRFYDLAQCWRDSGFMGAKGAYDRLHEWELRDDHLWRYEACARKTAIRRRRDFYSCLAKNLSAQYRYVILPDRDLSRERRFGEERDIQFTVAPQELRAALTRCFGDETIEAPWRGAHGVEEDEYGDIDWLLFALEYGRDEKEARAAREAAKSSGDVKLTGGKWARIKAKRKEKDDAERGTRKESGKDAEGLGGER